MLLSSRRTIGNTTSSMVLTSPSVQCVSYFHFQCQIVQNALFGKSLKAVIQGGFLFLATFDRGGEQWTYMRYYSEKHGLQIRNKNQPMLISRPRERDRRGGQEEVIKPFFLQ